MRRKAREPIAEDAANFSPKPLDNENLYAYYYEHTYVRTNVGVKAVDVVEKLEILADAAKYDVACTSSGIDRAAKAGRLGDAQSAGCCHSFTPDGRCITLLKVLMTNCCVYDCAYCVNRRSNEVPRAAFTPRELADLTIAFYRRNYIEGLFLSSGVLQSPDHTTELMIQALTILREEHRFNGYIHAKAIPGTSPELIDALGHLCDRLSVNLELPSRPSLDLLAPQKTGQAIIGPMRRIRESIAEDKETRAATRRRMTYYPQAAPKKKARAFAPAGQSTQIIIGATPENDFQILNLSAALYSSLSLKRVFFSAYIPVSSDCRLPQAPAAQLDREHRLYQADWLMRFYQFDASELIDADTPYLDPLIDPKANWAVNHLDFFPVEVCTAPLEALLRVPGIGPKGARNIIKARKTGPLGESELRRLGIAFKRARYFITCAGTYYGSDVDFSTEALRAKLAARIDGGRHGSRQRKVIEGQLSLFDGLDASGASLQAGAAAATAMEVRTAKARLGAGAGASGTKAAAAAAAGGAIEGGAAAALGVPKLPEAQQPLAAMLDAAYQLARANKASTLDALWRQPCTR